MYVVSRARLHPACEGSRKFVTHKIAMIALNYFIAFNY